MKKVRHTFSIKTTPGVAMVAEVASDAVRITRTENGLDQVIELPAHAIGYLRDLLRLAHSEERRELCP